MYYRLGQLFGMAIIHGGAAMCYMCESVFNFLSGMKPCDIVVGIDEIPIAHIRDMLIKVSTISLSFFFHTIVKCILCACRCNLLIQWRSLGKS